MPTPAIPRLDTIEGETAQQRKLRYNRAYYAAKREEVIAGARDYRRKNRDQISEKEKAQYAADPDKSKESNAAYYQRNKKRLAAENKRWRIENRDKIEAYYEANRDRRAARKAATRIANLERERAKCADWAARNPGYFSAKSARRHALKLLACPKWADKKAIEAIYQEAKRLQSATGTVYHVDHIVPLQGKTVCGLHVHLNLRAIPAIENLTKKNRLIECLLQLPRESSISA
jgi:hypothetical protein